MTSSVDLPPEASLVAMATLPAVGPARLAALAALGEPELTWTRLVATADDAALRASLVDRIATQSDLSPRRNSLEGLVRRWAASARDTDVGALWDRHRSAGVRVWRRGVAPYPDAAFATEAVPPTVLFSLGDPRSLDGARVAIVGTRSCTRYGLEVAAELAGALADAGVSIVSGLAAGVDAAAHRVVVGRDAAPPVAVVASGPDVVYPRTNAVLWGRVVARGLLLTEAPLGTRPEAWRFPQRNRIIAALADVVVVVESHRRGGAAITARHAMGQGRSVFAVPGPIRSPASAGCHDLIADGAGVCQGPDDLLLALGMTPGARRRCPDGRQPPHGVATEVLAALGWSPSSLDQLVAATGRSVGEVAAALDALGGAGWVVARGGWFEQLAPSTRDR